MSKTDYEKEYFLLKEKYEKLEKDYNYTNKQLYYIKCSRLYKISQKIRNLIRPYRGISKIIRITTLKSYKLKKFLKNANKVVIVPSSFEFDVFVNQRPINYAKYLANNGYKVIFVVWQWDEKTHMKNSHRTVSTNIFQISLYDFLDKNIDYINIRKKIFYINFPHKKFYELLYNYRSQSFIIHYDNMDEWEEFKKVDQAEWYDKNIEEKIILEADLVSAVSPALIEKFSYLRRDIQISPNGYYKHVTGEKNRNIALECIKDDKINIGYFGHLTDSWFDWDLLFDVANNNKNFIFHIIGYGASNNIIEKINKYSNINFYGKIPTNLLCNYVKEWNIGIIPFKSSKLARAVDPIKIYEYLFMGLPVIVTGIDHLKTYPKTYVVEGANEFIKIINKIADNKPNSNINEFLESSTWESRFYKFLELYDRKTISGLYEK